MQFIEKENIVYFGLACLLIYGAVLTYYKRQYKKKYDVVKYNLFFTAMTVIAAKMYSKNVYDEKVMTCAFKS